MRKGKTCPEIASLCVQEKQCTKSFTFCTVTILSNFFDHNIHNTNIMNRNL